MWQIQDKAESPNEPFILLSVFGQPSGSGSGPFDDIIDDVISRFPERSKVTKFKPFLTSSKRNFFAESIDKIDEAVGCLIESIASQHEYKLVWIINSLGYPVISKLMDKGYTMAMWIDWNVTVRAQRIIIEYLNGFFGGKMIVPEAHMTKLGGGHVEPSGGNMNVDNESIKYWTKSASKCLGTN